MSFLIHGYLPPNFPESYLRAVMPTLDMIEPSWSRYPDGVQLAQAYGARPDAKLIGYKTLTVLVETDRDIIGKPPPGGWVEEVYLHHKDGRRWLPQEAGYNNPAAKGLLNPGSKLVHTRVMSEQKSLFEMGYAGYRYDEAAIGWAVAPIDFNDCREWSSGTLYARALSYVCAVMRKELPGFIQLPSVMQFHEFAAVAPLFTACRGLSAENFPAGDGLFANWQGLTRAELAAWHGVTGRDYGFDGNNLWVGSRYEDTERTLVGAGRLMEWLDDRFDYVGMFFSNFPKGMSALSALAKSVGGHDIYWNCDRWRNPVTGQLPLWLS